MRIFVRLRALAPLFGLVLGLILAAPPGRAATPSPALPPLPGWLAPPPQFATAPGWGLPAPDAAAMAEYGLQSLERLRLARGPDTLQVEALYFRDTAGAFGAYTYYTAAATGDLHVYPFGRWLLHIRSPLASAPLRRALQPWAQALNGGLTEADLVPAIVSYLPLARRVPDSMRYAEGPAAFTSFCSWLPAAAVGFDHSAEAALATYESPGARSAQILVISYPTPQMARTRLPKFARMPGLEVKRSGPLLVLVHGADAATAAALLPKIKFDADFTLTPPVPVGIDALPGLLLGVFVLCGLIMAGALVVGLLIGLLRRYLIRTFPARFQHLSTKPLIQLHLRR